MALATRSLQYPMQATACLAACCPALSSQPDPLPSFARCRFNFRPSVLSLPSSHTRKPAHPASPRPASPGTQLVFRPSGAPTMAPHLVLDGFYLTLTLIISLGLQILGFSIAYSLSTDSITDLSGSITFAIIALVTLVLGGTYYPRNLTASIMVIVWATRLGGFLFFRVLKTGKDGRFDEMRVSWISGFGWVPLEGAAANVCSPSSSRSARSGCSNVRFAVPSIRDRSLIRAPVFWCWTVSLPVTILNSPRVSDPLLGGSDVAFGSARVCPAVPPPRLG